MKSLRQTGALIGGVIFIAALLGACSGGFLGPRGLYNIDPSRTQLRSGVVVDANGVQRVSSQTGPGALYELAVPPVWNGDLVLYAHGFVIPGTPIGFTPESSQFQDAFLSNGFAVAYSSYSENGWAVRDGAIRTKQLLGQFTSYFGTPKRTYLVGASLGGLIGLSLAERYSQQIDGALLLCAPAGGGQAQLDYIANVRILFDYFFPGVIPSSALSFPAGWSFDDVKNAVLNAVSTPEGFQKLAVMAGIDQLEIPWTTPDELIGTVLTAFGFEYYGYQDVLGRTHDHIMIDNSTTQYSDDDGTTGLSGSALTMLLAGVNQGVERFTETPDAAAYLDQWYAPTGTPKIPTILVNITRDPDVPFFHQSDYLQVLKPQYAGNLAYQTVAGYGHCDLPSEPAGYFFSNYVVPDFAALVDWVEGSGTKPVF